MLAEAYWGGELGALEDGTVKNYRMFVGGFLEHEGLDLEGLYALHKAYVDDGDPRSNRVVPLLVAEYCRGLVDGGLSTGHAANVAGAVKHFFMSNSLPFPLRSRDLPRVVKVGSRVALVDEIRRWYELCAGANYERRNKAVLMVSKDLGFRASDVSGLDVEHVYGARVVERDGEVFRVFQPFTTKKMGVTAYPHWGPEAEDAVMKNLDGRRTGPLFMDRDGKRLTPAALCQIFHRLKKRTGTTKLTHHSLRKYHRTALEARMPESYVKKLQGKATDPYIHPEQTGELTEAYLSNYDAIRVFKSDRELEKKVKELESKHYEVEGMATRIADLERNQRLFIQLLDETKKRGLEL